MRRLNAFIIILFFSVYGFSQNQIDTKITTDTKTVTDTKTDNKVTTDTKTDNKVTTDTKTDNKVITDTKTVNGTANEKKSDEKETQKLPEGYGNLTWGMYISDAKDKIAGTLVYTDDKKIIVSRDGELEYRYGFFYVDPTVIEEEVPAIEDKKNAEDSTGGTTAETVTGDTTAGDMANGEKAIATEEKKDEGKLFYVSLNFPYLDKDTVYNKIKNKYGKHTGDNIRNNQGAVAWDGGDTIVIMWIDNYKKKPYCRRVIYISKKISKELNEYTTKLFNKTELDLIKRINP